jgi:hypothetical protein
MVATVALRVVTKAVQVHRVQQPARNKLRVLPHPRPVVQTCLTWMTIFRFEAGILSA